MSSVRSQILTLLAAHRIDVSQADRLLAIAIGRERFVTLALSMVLVCATVAANPLPPHAAEHFNTALNNAAQSAQASPAYQHFRLILNRLLGELP